MFGTRTDISTLRAKKQVILVVDRIFVFLCFIVEGPF
jgi:hypothetical protein